jgi:hypothetical protein
LEHFEIATKGNGTMSRSFGRLVLTCAALAALLVAAGQANAGTLKGSGSGVKNHNETGGFFDQTFTETSSGIVIDLATSVGTLSFGSDGESPFDPFGVGHDQSDAVKLSTNPAWVQVNNNWNNEGNGIWTASAAGENEPSIENIGKWYLPGFVLGTAPFTWTIYSEDGKLSDLISFADNGPNGNVAITFASDPLPEPGSLTLLGLGVAGLVGYGLRRRLQRKASV